MASDHPAFLGQGWAFPPAFDNRSGTADMVAADDDILQSLGVLFETRPGERVMHPTFGCRIHDYVFEPLNAATLRGMATAIRRAILFFEPRIILDDVKVSVVDAHEGRLDITLVYRVRQTNSRSNVVFPFYQKEGTLITNTPKAVTQ